MSRLASYLTVSGLGAICLMIAPGTSQSQPKAANPPRLLPVAETKLLMEGMVAPNFAGLEQLLAEKPDEAEAWSFARGQALLIAEAGNLLMMRPPRNQGQDEWMERATALRSAATKLARAAADKDHETARSGVIALANTCNRCHQTFRVDVRVRPFARPNEKPPARPDGDKLPMPRPKPAPKPRPDA